MKLLFAIKGLNSNTGGAERVFCTICSELDGRGHEVLVATFDQPNGQSFYPLNKRIRRIDLGIGDVERHARVGETLQRMWALRRMAMAEKPHAVVGFMHSMFVPLAFALAGTGIPVIGSEHIVPEHYQTRPLQYALLVSASPLLSKVTVVSDAIRIRYPAPIRKRMIVVPNPVMTVMVSHSAESAKSLYRVLNVGRLDAQKDQMTLLRAFGHIAREYPDWELKIVGDGALRGQLEQFVRELGLEGRVHLPGITTNIQAEYGSADVFVMSSRYESFGLATAEAMSHGLPAIGFADCPGTNELIAHGTTGLLADAGPDRSVMLSREMARLMSDPELRRRLGMAARAAIERTFSIQTICGLWESLLDEVSMGTRSRHSVPSNEVL